MAEIPVERKAKSAFPLWLIPLLLLLLLLPLLYFTCGRSAVVVDNTNGNRAVVGANANNVLANAGNSIGNGANTVANSIGSGVNAIGNTVGNAVVVTNGSASAANSAVNPQSGRTIEAVNFFGTTADKQTLVGRRADFRAARVERVLSDRVFTVKSGDAEMFVLMSDALDDAVDGRPRRQIKTGETIRLQGEFRNLPDAETQEERGRGLSAAELGQMKGQAVYLHAEGLAANR